MRAALDTDEYPTGVKVDDATMASLHLIPEKFPWRLELRDRSKRIGSNQEATAQASAKVVKVIF